MANNTSSSAGVGFSGLLTIVFVVLKLTEVIDWSWWWVVSPIWIAIALILAVVLLYIGIGLMWELYKSLRDKRRRAKRKQTCP